VARVIAQATAAQVVPECREAAAPAVGALSMMRAFLEGLREQEAPVAQDGQSLDSHNLRMLGSCVLFSGTHSFRCVFPVTTADSYI